MLKNEKIHGQITDVIYNVVKFMGNEGDAGSFTIPVPTSTQKRSSDRTSSTRCYRKLKNKEEAFMPVNVDTALRLRTRKGSTLIDKR
jgi:hypothetical protein